MWGTTPHRDNNNRVAQPANHRGRPIRPTRRVRPRSTCGPPVILPCVQYESESDFMKQIVNTFRSSCLLFRRCIILQGDTPHIRQARPLVEAIVKIKDFEKKVRDRDGITVVIRARRTANIGNYRESRANHTMDISDYIINNLSAYLDNAYELVMRRPAVRQWVP